MKFKEKLFLISIAKRIRLMQYLVNGSDLAWHLEDFMEQYLVPCLEEYLYLFVLWPSVADGSHTALLRSCDLIYISASCPKQLNVISNRPIIL